ncbi:tyrosine-type recombinase/integrase [Actinoplanes sp. OR16]|uniref:tyrosine-type recombinase/integrase n=1 Tax=Actinoplanes sp. OR16 TaxID=946334 RepID=UPI0018D552E9|nr:tyrosine-type recombinase/integrase [Actinoplanes sp. OR16]
MGKFEALITAARLSININDFALVALLGLLGLRIFEACGANIAGRMDRHAATRRLKHLAETADLRIPKMHPHMLRHTFVTTMLDAGVSLRDVQITARHAGPRTTIRYDRARKDLDRHPNYILAAFMASGT